MVCDFFSREDELGRGRNRSWIVIKREEFIVLQKIASIFPKSNQPMCFPSPHLWICVLNSPSRYATCMLGFNQV